MDRSVKPAHQVAGDFADKLRGIIPKAEIRQHGVKLDADLCDVEVEHDGWGITVSVDKRGQSFRLILDDYVIEDLSQNDALSFIAALAEGRATVRVSTLPILGKVVNLEVQPSSSRRVSSRRKWRSGLADWEQRLLISNSPA